MPLLIEVPDQYGYVLAAATSTIVVHILHLVRTSKFRKLSGIKYPNAYATPEQADKDKNAFIFNCAQRAHANFTENLTPFLSALLISGLRFPTAAGVIGAGWSVSRMLYLFGYTSSAGPPGREVGAVGSTLGAFSLAIMAAYTSAKLIL